MSAHGRETITTTVWKDTDGKGKSATTIYYEYHINYFDHPGFLGFIEWAETALISFTRYEPLLDIRVLNDHAGEPSNGLYYAVSLKTDDKALAALFKLRWGGAQ